MMTDNTIYGAVVLETTKEKTLGSLTERGAWTLNRSPLKGLNLSDKEKNVTR
jgi:hypothetical protein